MVHRAYIFRYHSATPSPLIAQVTLLMLYIAVLFVRKRTQRFSVVYNRKGFKHWPGITYNNKNRFTVKLNVLFRIILYVFDRLMFSDGFLV